MGSIPTEVKRFFLCLVWFPVSRLLGLTPSGLFMGLSSTLIYTSELILCSMFVYSFVRLRYFPLQLSPAFIATRLFGDEALTDDLLLDSFRFYLSSEERETLDECFAGRLSPNDGEILDLLSSLKCYRNPTEENLKEIILELAHQEFVQKPRYGTNCW